MKKIQVTYIVGFFVAAFMLFSLQKQTSMRQSIGGDDFAKALVAWEEKNLETAAMLLGEDHHKYIEREHGCELGISVFAKLHEYEKVERIAHSCRHKVPAMALEGYAFALSFQGKFDEAIATLEKFEGYDLFTDEEKKKSRMALAKVLNLKGHYHKSVGVLTKLALEEHGEMVLPLLLKTLKQSKNSELVLEARQAFSQNAKIQSLFEKKWKNIEKSHHQIETKNIEQTS
ncbi:MAG: hypothetical protein AB8C84_00565 [Oligoflexales bacterium]